MAHRSAGPFEILEVLGEGSFGTVCVARVSTDPLRRKVALKILKGAYTANTKILNRTRDEARLLSRISHPNIVKVERLMEVNGRPVVVMEHVRGVSLDKLLMRYKEGLPVSVALEIVRQMCTALQVAYSEAMGEDGRPLRVIHRDIKPSNVMLSVHGQVKVLDFGIARGEFEGREANTESVVMGSRPYMAPERLDGVSDNPSVDVYSSGMSLFELLTGRTMSLSINPVSHDQAMKRQLQFVNVAGLTDQSQGDLRNLIQRMCAYTRDYRPSAADCAREMDRLQNEIDAENSTTLDEFARTVVGPIYESRPRVSPDEVFGESGESEFLLKEVTNNTTRSTPKARSIGAPMKQYTFLIATAFVVVLLAALAMIKFVANNKTTDGVSSSETVRLKVWFPPEATARVRSQTLTAPGALSVEPGAGLLELFFDNGNSWHCTFVASQATTVRWAGNGTISINDGPPRPCLRHQQ